MNISWKVSESPQNRFQLVGNDGSCYPVKFQASMLSISALPGCYSKATTWILKIGTWHENIFARKLWHENRLEHVDSRLCVACLWLELVCLVSRWVPGKNLNVCKLPKTWNEQKISWKSLTYRFLPEKNRVKRPIRTGAIEQLLDLISLTDRVVMHGYKVVGHLARS